MGNPELQNAKHPKFQQNHTQTICNKKKQKHKEEINCHCSKGLNLLFVHWINWLADFVQLSVR